MNPMLTLKIVSNVAYVRCYKNILVQVKVCQCPVTTLRGCITKMYKVLTSFAVDSRLETHTYLQIRQVFLIQRLPEILQPRLAMVATSNLVRSGEGRVIDMPPPGDRRVSELQQHGKNQSMCLDVVSRLHISFLVRCQYLTCRSGQMSNIRENRIFPNYTLIAAKLLNTAA